MSIKVLLGGALCAAIAVVSPAYATTGNPVVAAVQLRPGPEPRAGAETYITVRLRDARGGVVPADRCLCTLQIYQEASTTPRRVARISLRDEGTGLGSRLVGAIRFDWPGRYILTLTGTPAYMGALPSFIFTKHTTVR